MDKHVTLKIPDFSAIKDKPITTSVGTLAGGLMLIWVFGEVYILQELDASGLATDAELTAHTLMEAVERKAMVDKVDSFAIQLGGVASQLDILLATKQLSDANTTIEAIEGDIRRHMVGENTSPEWRETKRLYAERLTKAIEHRDCVRSRSLNCPIFIWK